MATLLDDFITEQKIGSVEEPVEDGLLDSFLEEVREPTERPDPSPDDGLIDEFISEQGISVSTEPSPEAISLEARLGPRQTLPSEVTPPQPEAGAPILSQAIGVERRADEPLTDLAERVPRPIVPEREVRELSPIQELVGKKGRLAAKAVTETFFPAFIREAVGGTAIEDEAETISEKISESIGGVIGSVSGLLGVGGVLRQIGKVVKIPGYARALASLAKKSPKTAQFVDAGLKNALVFSTQGQLLVPTDTEIGDRAKQLAFDSVIGVAFTTAHVVGSIPKIGKIAQPVALFGIGAAGAETQEDAIIGGVTLVLLSVLSRGGTLIQARREAIKSLEPIYGKDAPKVFAQIQESETFRRVQNEIIRKRETGELKRTQDLIKKAKAGDKEAKDILREERALIPKEPVKRPTEQLTLEEFAESRAKKPEVSQAEEVTIRRMDDRGNPTKTETLTRKEATEKLNKESSFYDRLLACMRS